MSADDRAAGAGARAGPELFRPSMAERLAAPPEGGREARASRSTAPRPAGRAERQGLPMPRMSDPGRGSILKQVEWFFAALPRLGRTYRQAKAAARAMEETAQRAAAAEGGLVREAERIDEAHRRLDDLGDVAGRIDEAFRRLDDVGDVAGRLDEAFRRLDDLGDVAGRLGGIAERIDGIAGRIDGIAEAAEAGGRAALGRVEAAEAALGDRIGALEAHVGAHVGALADRLAALAERGAAERALAARAASDLGRKLDILRHGSLDGGLPAGTAAAPPGQGLEALLDAFYNRLEARFRGSREEIMRRLAIYLPDAEAAVACTGGRVLDLGCGRGEWLELLASRGVPAEGVDLNPVQAGEARAAGLAVTEGDALAYLAAQPDGSLAMVSAHHVVEHLPFRMVAHIAREAMAKLAPGGLLLLETPNPNALIVGARSFHMDPTHIRPLPAEVLETLLDTVGFHPVETRHLHPHEKLDTFFRERRIDPEIAGLIFGPQDLAVIGTRPALAGPGAGAPEG